MDLKKTGLNLKRSLDGGACVNQRSLQVAFELFGRERASEGKNAPLKMSDLLEALWVLELAIVSKALSFDGTLPPGDIEGLRAGANTVFKEGRFGSGFVRGVSPKNEEEQKAFAAAAAAKALADLGCWREAGGGEGFGPTEGLDTALDQSSCDAFFKKVNDLFARNHRDAGAASDDEIAHLLGGSFRGSKCVAGLAMLGKPALEQALAVPERFNTSAAISAASLINRFRFSYVRNLAYSARDVYVPAQRWRQLSVYHSITFADVVRKTLAEQHGGRLTKELESQVAAEFGGSDHNFSVALPPIGLYVLMTAPPITGPIGVVKHARDTFSRYGAAFRKFWTYTREIKAPEEGWTGGPSGDPLLDETSETIERALTDKLGALRGSRGRASVMERIVTSVVAIGGSTAGGFAGAAAGGMIAGPPGAAAGFIAGAATSELIKNLYGIAKDGAKAHSDDYRALDEALFRAFAGSLNLGALEDRVERVLGRKLQRFPA